MRCSTGSLLARRWARERLLTDAHKGRHADDKHVSMVVITTPWRGSFAMVRRCAPWFERIIQQSDSVRSLHPGAEQRRPCSAR